MMLTWWILIDEFAAGLGEDIESMRKVLEGGDYDGLQPACTPDEGRRRELWISNVD